MNIFINSAAVSNSYSQYLKFVVSNLTNHSIIFYSIAPKTFKLSRERFTKTSWAFICVQLCIKVIEDGLVCCLIKSLQFLKSQRRKIKFPLNGHWDCQARALLKFPQKEWAYQCLFQSAQCASQQLNNPLGHLRTLPMHEEHIHPLEHELRLPERQAVYPIYLEL